MEQLLSWVYTGTLQLTPATVVPLLVTATEYELPDLQVGVCRVHLRPDCKGGGGNGTRILTFVGCVQPCTHRPPWSNT